METIAGPFLSVAAKGAGYLAQSEFVQNRFSRVGRFCGKTRQSAMAATFGLYADRSRLRWHVIGFVFLAPIPLSVIASAAMALSETARDARMLFDRRRLGHRHPEQLDKHVQTMRRFEKPCSAAPNHLIVEVKPLNNSAAAFSFCSKGNKTFGHDTDQQNQNRHTGIEIGPVSSAHGSRKPERLIS